MNRFLVFVFALFCFTANINAQKSQNDARKAAKSRLTEKVTKDVRKEAKKFEKEGWLTAPGALPLAKQFERSQLKELEEDANGYPKFIMGEGMSIAQNYDAAKMQATEIAKQNLAGKIQTEVTALIETSVNNKQLSDEDATSAVETVISSKSLISQSIGRTLPMVECYRVKENKNKEVMVRLAYSSDLAMQAAKKAIQQELAAKNKDLHDKLSQILGW